MIAIANFAVLFLLSMIGTKHSTMPDPHGLHKFSQDAVVREMLTEGRFREFEAAVAGYAGTRLAIDIGSLHGGNIRTKAVKEAINTSSDLTSLMDTLVSAVKVASLVAELQAAGPAKAAALAVSWLESGLVRKSGIKQSAFPSLFNLIENGSAKGLDDDLLGAHGKMDSNYGEMLGRLAETFL